MPKLQLYLDSAIVYPGQTITGKAICIFVKDTCIRKVSICFTGKEQICVRNGKQRNKTKKEFFKNEHYGFPGGRIEAGLTEFPFEFFVPPDQPTTFNSDVGYITYKVKAVIEMVLAKDRKAKQVVTVISPLDLTRSPRSGSVAEVEPQNEVGLLCCKTGPIILEMKLDKPKYTYGEPIKINLYCKNRSDSDISEIGLKLRLIIKYRVAKECGKSEKKEKKSLISWNQNGLEAYGDQRYGIVLKLPANFDIRNFDQCTKFNQLFNIQALAIMRGSRLNLKLLATLHLGRISYTHDSCEGATVSVQSLPVNNLSTGPSFQVSHGPTSITLQPFVEAEPSAPPYYEIGFRPSVNCGPPPYEEAMKHGRRQIGF